MSFFYDLNKKLDGIRATPEVTHQQLNERAMSRAAKGYEKYGKEGMEALAKAGREGKALDPVRAKYDKYDESVNESAAAGYDPEMQARIKTATPQQLAQMAQELAGGAGPQYNSELKMLQQAQSELSGQMGEGRHSQDAMALNPDFDKIGRKPGVMDRVARGAKKLADVLAPGDDELLDRLEKSSGAAPRQPKAKEPRYMEAMSPAKQKSFAALAPPKDKITFADKIAGAKKEVDEMLGDVAAEAMKKALGGGRSRGQGMEEASDDNAFTAHKRPRTDTPKVGTITHGSKHDVEEIPGGRRVTRRTDAQGISVGADDDKPADGEKRGRGRPKGPAKAPERVTGGATRHKGGRKMTKEGGGMMKHTFAILDDTLIDQIANMNGAEVDPDAGSVGTYDENTARQLIAFAQKNPQRLKRTQTMNTAGMRPMAQFSGGSGAGPEYNLKEAGSDYGQTQQIYDELADARAVAKQAQRGGEFPQGFASRLESVLYAAMTLIKNQQAGGAQVSEEELDEKATSKKQQKFMGMVHAAQKGEKPASGAVAKVAKDMGKKDVKDFAATKHKGLPEKKKPEAKDKKKEVEETSDNTPGKSSGGFKFGGSIYDSINRDLENMIAESMSRLDESMSINMSMNNDEHGGPTRSLTVTATDDDAAKLAQLLKSAGLGGGDSSYGSEQHMHEVSMNQPDYPTNTETSDDALQYSGGLNKPKSTGQTTIPVIASQDERQESYAAEEEDAIKRMMEMAGMSAAGGASAGDYIDYVSASGEQPPEDLIMQNGVEYDPDTNVISVRNATSLANTHRAITAAGWKKQAAGARPNPAAAGQAMQAGDTAYQLGEQDAIDRMMEIAGQPMTNREPLDEGMMDKLKSLVVPKLMKLLGPDAVDIANAVKQATGGDLSPTKENAMRVVQALGIDKAAEQGQSPQMAEGIAGNWQGKLRQALYTVGLLGSTGAFAAMTGTPALIMGVIGVALLMMAEATFGSSPGSVGVMGKFGNKGTSTQRGLDIHGNPITNTNVDESDDLSRMMEMAGVKKKAVEEEKTDEGNLFTKGLADDNVKVGDKIPGTDAVKKKDIDESIFAMTANLWKTYKG